MARPITPPPLSDAEELEEWEWIGQRLVEVRRRMLKTLGKDRAALIDPPLGAALDEVATEVGLLRIGGLGRQ